MCFLKYIFVPYISLFHIIGYIFFNCATEIGIIISEIIYIVIFVGREGG